MHMTVSAHLLTAWSILLLLAGCGREQAAPVFPDRVSLETLGLPAGLRDWQQWHLRRTETGWEPAWERRAFDGEGRLVEEWRTRRGRPEMHRRYTFDEAGRVARLDHRVVSGQVGGFQRYHYTGQQVECQHFNAAKRLTRRERLHYDTQGRLLRRQSWLFEENQADDGSKNMDLNILHGQDGTVWSTQSVDGRVRSRQARRGALSVLVHYDDSGQVVSQLLASARGTSAYDRQAGSTRCEWQDSTAEGLRAHVLHRQSDGSLLHQSMVVGADGEPIRELAEGAGVPTQGRYLYQRDGAGRWHLKVLVENGRVAACWQRRLVFGP